MISEYSQAAGVVVELVEDYISKEDIYFKYGKSLLTKCLPISLIQLTTPHSAH
jgi:hypothetical protein